MNNTFFKRDITTRSYHDFCSFSFIHFSLLSKHDWHANRTTFVFITVFSVFLNEFFLGCRIVPVYNLQFFCSMFYCFLFSPLDAQFLSTWFLNVIWNCFWKENKNISVWRLNFSSLYDMPFIVYKLGGSVFFCFWQLLASFHLNFVFTPQNLEPRSARNQIKFPVH